jgi:general nucleoside transport system permease protein
VLPVLLSFLLDVDYWNAVVRVSTPLALAALACVVCSRAGILYVGVEGVALLSAFFSLACTAWTDSIWIGVLGGVAAGIGASLLLGLFAMLMDMGDVIGGLVLSFGAVGLTAFLNERWFPTGAATGAKSLEPLWGGFGGPLVELFLHQQPLVYVALALGLGFQFFLRTRWGLMLRSSGESTRVARSFGVPLVGLRFATLAVAGALTGLAGAVIALAIVGSFDPNMVGGRGFIALACVMLGAWRPLGAILAAAFFGAAYALQFRAGVGQLGGWVQLTPYLLTLAVLAAFWGRARGPAEEGRGLSSEVR